MVAAALLLPYSQPLLNAQAKKAAPAQATAPIDKIFKLVTMKLPEASIINSIRQAGKGLKVTPDDLIRFKEAGASDNVIVALTDAMSDAPAVNSGSASTASAGLPKQASTPAAAPYNTNLATLGCTQSATERRKRIVAVEDFEFGAVKDSAAAIFGTNVDIGKGIQSLFVKRLADQQKFRIVERARINKVMAEQDFGASNRVKQGTQPRLGRIIGADAILAGTITTFGRDDQRKNLGTGGYGPRILGGIKLKTGEAKAVVAITYRLIDAETSEVIATGEARGESRRSSKGLDLSGFTNRGGGSVSADMTSTNFAETIIGEATIDAVDRMAAELNANEGKVQERSIDIEGRIAEVADKLLYLSIGQNDGVGKCDRFEILKIVKEIKDPVTKETIDMMTERIGEMLVTEVRERIATGYYHGTAAPAVGLLARKITKAPQP